MVIDGGTTAVSLVVSEEERVDAITHMGRKIYLFSTLTVDYPEGIRLGIPGRGIHTENAVWEILDIGPSPTGTSTQQSHGIGKDNVNT